ncbi:MAG: hypothetical protein E7I40_09010, partial [Finegoldia magna]|uniref:hypothetical protein n=1 Tax=Finegoldia magna TaxID=1260 RepID=UPI00290EFBD8
TSSQEKFRIEYKAQNKHIRLAMKKSMTIDFFIAIFVKRKPYAMRMVQKRFYHCHKKCISSY